MGNKYVGRKDCDEAFLTLKKLLTTSPVLAQRDIAKPFDIYCDAFGTGLSVCLNARRASDFLLLATIEMP
jgi:hypothetical protein